MSAPVWHRRNPAGHGLQKLAEAMRNPAPHAIASPPEDVNQLKALNLDSFTLSSFTHEDALELGHLLHARLAPFASAEGRPALISISLASGAVVFQAATGPGIVPDNESWVRRKRATVTRFGVSSWLMHCKFGGDERAFAAKYGLGPETAAGFAIHGGGVPIRVRGVEGVVGVVVVSGLKQHEDHGVIADVISEGWQQKDL
jgi:uncharacterized protein (UPF0303 family)